MQYDPDLVKRMLDILISSAALVITLPVNGILLVCTYFDVGSPVIFRQKRIGKDCSLISKAA